MGDLAVELIGGADRDLVHVAEDIQLGQRDIRRALYLHAIACGHQVNGPYPAGAARLGAILRAGLPQLFRVGTEPLAGERPLAHAGGICLHHAHHFVDLCRGQPRADRRVSGDGVGGGGVGIDTVVQVAQRAKLSLEQNGLALCLRLPQIPPGVRYIGPDLRGIRLQPRGHLRHGIALGAIDLLQYQIFPLQQVLQVRHQAIGIQQFTGLNGLFLVLIGVERRDALLGGAVHLVLQPRLLQRVQLPVPRQQQGGPVADHQVFRGDADAGRADRFHLRHQVFAVQRHAVAQDIHHAGAEHAGGQQMQGEFAHIVDNGVPGVAAALIPHHHIILPCQIVHHAALSLVAPVDTYDRAICHIRCLRSVLFSNDGSLYAQQDNK